MRAVYSLSDPLPVRYLHWISGIVLHGEQFTPVDASGIIDLADGVQRAERLRQLDA